MSQPTSPLDPTLESVLACVNCARSKAKCDRKVPCTRCVEKKLTCQARVPQRRPGRVLFQTQASSQPKRPSSRKADAPEPPRTTDDAVTTREGKGLPGQRKVQGVFADWGHAGQSLQALRAERPPLVTNTSSEGESYPPTPSADSSFVPPRLLEMNDIFDFPPGLPSPSIQVPDLPQMPHWELAFTVSPGPFADSSGENSAMDDFVPGLSSLPSSVGSVDDQLQALEGWPLFQCNPVTPSTICAPTAALHIKYLYMLLKDGNMAIDPQRLVESDITIEPLLASTREKLIAVLQGLFNEAQQIYGLRGMEAGSISPSLDSVGPSILLLPPPPVLEFLFRAYRGGCEPYYPFVPTVLPKINERMEGRNTILPSMLMLLMLAAGAMRAGAGERYHQMAHGLVEICRLSLRTLIEQNMKLASDPEILQCGLLLILVAVWSGDKWQMDIAVCLKPMLLEMHLKAGYLDHRDAQVARLDTSGDADHCWGIWREQERANRITYSWLILDHEICLFQDVPSTAFLSITNLNLPIPSPDAAWSASSAEHCVQAMAQLSPDGSQSIPPSLNEYIRRFRETSDVTTIGYVSLTTLRLILCNLQNLVIQLRAAIDGSIDRRQAHKPLQRASIVLQSVQIQEAQELLHRWYGLAMTQPASEMASSTMSVNLVLYHLVALNTMVSFAEVESVARSDVGSQSGKPPHWKRAYHLESTREIDVHCGQILRLMRSIPEQARPSWWPGAVYRVALIAWANCLCRASTDTAPSNASSHPWDDTLALDVLPTEHPSIAAYLNHQGGTPVFSDSNGTTVPLSDPGSVVRYCASFLDTDLNTKLTLGIQRKLRNMVQRWDDTGLSLSAGWSW
ncbi:Zn(II)2Cys6 transcription factor domain-containing protein [Aspergillus lucknowensis]|uniref:Zn(2)-C6 fungal-type domain-containing protein n=1 Tax=Aspergillus lucknowensis TaxID=176173 RepID=A0ABR4LTL4_9EURO